MNNNFTMPPQAIPLPKGMMDFVIAVADLLKFAASTVSLFYDSAQGASAFAEKLEGLAAIGLSQGRTREDALTATVMHGTGDPNAGGRGIVSAKLGDVMERCKMGGSNEQLLGTMCLISIFAYWESQTRNKIALALKIPHNNVTSDLFGDIRILRNVLLHAHGVADGTVEKCIVLKWFKRGDRVVISRERLLEVYDHIKNFPNGLKTEGFKPPGVS